jgi:hypothetical protein
MAHNPEQKRFVETLDVYYSNSRGISRKPPGTSSGGTGTGTTPSASANKTIQSRKTLYGDKATSGAGIQSIKKAGLSRTNSKKPIK